ncbi:hypothetical protein BKM30_22970 [Pseudomonas syringae pv. syringae]|nr:hypothetical protein BKM27_23535 [Pseudomonas syringae pv. syringae]POR75063.1 hypothetical protein BKM30_22970 [Pseudomonas syringae pv. syringae]
MQFEAAIVACVSKAQAQGLSSRSWAYLKQDWRCDPLQGLLAHMSIGLLASQMESMRILAEVSKKVRAGSRVSANRAARYAR